MYSLFPMTSRFPFKLIAGHGSSGINEAKLIKPLSDAITGTIHLNERDESQPGTDEIRTE